MVERGFRAVKDSNTRAPLASFGSRLSLGCFCEITGGRTAVRPYGTDVALYALLGAIYTSSPTSHGGDSSTKRGFGDCWRT